MGTPNVAGRYPQINVAGLSGPDSSVTASVISTHGFQNQAINNPIGLTPAVGALVFLDGTGAGVVGGTDQAPTSARTGIAGSGRGNVNVLNQCMTSSELNAHMGGTAPSQGPAGWGEPFEGARVDSKLCWNCTTDSVSRQA